MGAGVEICALMHVHSLGAAPTAVAEAVAALPARLGVAGIFGITTLGLLAALIAVVDLRTMRVPDVLTAAIALCGLAWLFLQAENWASFWQASLFALVRMAVCGAVLLLLREAYYRLRHSDGLGLGDVKLCAAAALWLPLDILAAAVLAASMAALITVVLVHFLGGKWQRNRKIPLAAYLAPMIWLLWLGHVLLNPVHILLP